MIILFQVVETKANTVHWGIALCTISALNSRLATLHVFHHESNIEVIYLLGRERTVK